MKYTTPLLAVFLVLLAGAFAWAQCPTTCPEPFPTPCPAPEQVCPPVCPCPCPASVPAAVGAGPAGDLMGLECPEFDPAFAQKMYEQNSVIIAVTQFGQQRATDNNLRNISGEINKYMTSANEKLDAWYGCAVTLGADCPRAEAIIAELSKECGECFDVAYAKTLSTLLKQSNCAEEIGSTQAVTQPMREQAEFLTRKTSGWTFRLDRWLTDRGCG